MLFFPDLSRCRPQGPGCLYHTHPQTSSEKRMFVSDFPQTPCGTQPVSQSSLLRLEKVREVEEFLYACVWNNEASVGWLVGDRSVCRSDGLGGRRFLSRVRRLCRDSQGGEGGRSENFLLLAPTRSEETGIISSRVGLWVCVCVSFLQIQVI